ncbi:MAG: TerB family tellurite resistance protein [Pseudomonadota bacterium]
MALFDFEGVLKIFRGSDPTAEELAQLHKEVMLLTLARATSADSNIKSIEIERVRDVLKARTGEDFPLGDIRVAAKSEILDREPLTRYLSASAKKLSWEARLSIAEALVDVIKADGRISPREATFFNNVTLALEVTPAQLMGLIAET